MFSNNSLVLKRGVGAALAFMYATNDTKNAIEGAGYFNAAVKHLKKGAMIDVAGDLDGTPFHTSYVVSSNNGTDVVLTEHAAVTQNVMQEINFTKISTKAADAEVFRFVPSFAGRITKFYSVLNAALATGNATLTLAINGVAVTNGVITATQAGSAAGDVDVATPTAANTFAAGDVITVTVGGASTATATANGTLQLTPT
ncbi:MAG TPA: hypothetical protein PLW48_03820 [Alphaproteobacteria bacterium]|nr:hypothetical protein [Rhodospirillaceae bacterium]HRJ66240.1 hypothetical protein [Alphaproteobacteria bacterium]